MIPDSLIRKDLSHLQKLVTKGRLAKANKELADHGYQYAVLGVILHKGT
jgi:hypothetical protein